MIITPKYFTRNYMARQRHSFRDQYESLVDLPEREKDDMPEALYSKYGSASGTYKVENDTLTFEPIVGGNPPSWIDGPLANSSWIQAAHDCA